MIKSNNSYSLNKISKMRLLFIISFVIVPILNFIVFYIYVNFSAILMAFQTVKNGKIIYTLNNFNRFFNEFSVTTSSIREAFTNTFYTFLIIQLMFFIGVMVSYFLYKKIFMHAVIRYMFFLPGLIVPTVITSYFLKIINVDGPIAPFIQKLFGLEYLPTLLTDTQFANPMVWMHLIWITFPGNMILWGGSFSRIPESVLESAQLDGINWFQELVRIIIPMVWPTFAMLWLLTFANFFGSTGQVFLLTQGRYGTNTVVCWMYLQVYNNRGGVSSGAYNYLSAVGLIVSTCAIVIATVVRKLTKQNSSAVQY